MVNPIPPDLVPPLPPDAPPFPKARKRKTLVPRRELITERRIKATQIRLAGLSCEEIGMRMNADPMDLPSVSRRRECVAPPPRA